MSTFLTNIQKLKREVKSIQVSDKNEDKLNNEIDYKVLYEENEAKLQEITIHAKNIENKLEEIKEEYSKQETKFDELKNYKDENYVLKDTIIKLQNEIRNSKEIKFIDNLKEEMKNLNDGIDFWKDNSDDMENQFHLERNNHGKTKLKLKNLSNYCDDLKINHATEIDDLKEKLQETNKKYNSLVSNIKKFFE